jgi:hypothetical protein
MFIVEKNLLSAVHEEQAPFSLVIVKLVARIARTFL